MDPLTLDNQVTKLKDILDIVSVQKSEETTFNDYPDAAVNNAKKALRWRKEHGRDVVKGGTSVGWQRANQLANREKLSKSTIRRMAAFNRHRKNSKVDPKFKSEPWRDRGYVAWLIWGGTSGVNWAIRKSESFKNQKALTQKKEMDCPPATQDIKLNTKNRDATIKLHMYGPLNVDEPGDYWDKIADKWETSVEAAKKSLCDNCVAFDVSPRMKDCIPGETSDDDGELGYCWMHHFKCHSARTCNTWAKGGPIKKDEDSYMWQEKNIEADEKKKKTSKSITKKDHYRFINMVNDFGGWEWGDDYEITGYKNVLINKIKVNSDFEINDEDVEKKTKRVRPMKIVSYLSSKDKMKPLITDSNYNLLDGYHRLYCLKKKNQQMVRVAVVKPKTEKMIAMKKANPCWDGYEQRGMKKGKDGKPVPNCVPVSKAADDPKTPAPKKDRIRGSDKNKEGSASGQRGGIKLSQDVIKSIEKKVKEHNEKVKEEGLAEWRKINVGQAKAVVRRGLGAYSTSHRPSVTSRTQWGLARLNAFIHLMLKDKPKNPKYVTDNDLLPKKHPRHSAEKKSLDIFETVVKMLDMTEPDKDVYEKTLDILDYDEVEADKLITFNKISYKLNAEPNTVEYDELVHTIDNLRLEFSNNPDEIVFEKIMKTMNVLPEDGEFIQKVLARTGASATNLRSQAQIVDQAVERFGSNAALQDYLKGRSNPTASIYYNVKIPKSRERDKGRKVRPGAAESAERQGGAARRGTKRKQRISLAKLNKMKFVQNALEGINEIIEEKNKKRKKKKPLLQNWMEIDRNSSFYSLLREEGKISDKQDRLLKKAQNQVKKSRAGKQAVRNVLNQFRKLGVTDKETLNPNNLSKYNIGKFEEILDNAEKEGKWNGNKREKKKAAKELMNRTREALVMTGRKNAQWWNLKDIGRKAQAQTARRLREEKQEGAQRAKVGRQLSAAQEKGADKEAIIQNLTQIANEAEKKLFDEPGPKAWMRRRLKDLRDTKSFPGRLTKTAFQAGAAGFEIVRSPFGYGVEKSGKQLSKTWFKEIWGAGFNSIDVMTAEDIENVVNGVGENAKVKDSEYFKNRKSEERSKLIKDKNAGRHLVEFAALGKSAYDRIKSIENDNTLDEKGKKERTDTAVRDYLRQVRAYESSAVKGQVRDKTGRFGGKQTVKGELGYDLIGYTKDSAGNNVNPSLDFIKENYIMKNSDSFEDDDFANNLTTAKRTAEKGLNIEGKILSGNSFRNFVSNTADKAAAQKVGQDGAAIAIKEAAKAKYKEAKDFTKFLKDSGKKFNNLNDFSKLKGFQRNMTRNQLVDGNWNSLVNHISKNKELFSAGLSQEERKNTVAQTIAELTTPPSEKEEGKEKEIILPKTSEEKEKALKKFYGVNSQKVFENLYQKNIEAINFRSEQARDESIRDVNKFEEATKKIDFSTLQSGTPEERSKVIQGLAKSLSDYDKRDSRKSTSDQVFRRNYNAVNSKMSSFEDRISKENDESIKRLIQNNVDKIKNDPLYKWGEKTSNKKNIYGKIENSNHRNIIENFVNNHFDNLSNGKSVSQRGFVPAGSTIAKYFNDLGLKEYVAKENEIGQFINLGDGNPTKRFKQGGFGQLSKEMFGDGGDPGFDNVSLRAQLANARKSNKKNKQKGNKNKGGRTQNVPGGQGQRTQNVADALNQLNLGGVNIDDEGNVQKMIKSLGKVDKKLLSPFADMMKILIDKPIEKNEPGSTSKLNDQLNDLTNLSKSMENDFYSNSA